MIDIIGDSAFELAIPRRLRAPIPQVQWKGCISCSSGEAGAAGVEMSGLGGERLTRAFLEGDPGAICGYYSSLLRAERVSAQANLAFINTLLDRALAGAWKVRLTVLHAGESGVPTPIPRELLTLYLVKKGDWYRNVRLRHLGWETRVALDPFSISQIDGDFVLLPPWEEDPDDGPDTPRTLVNWLYLREEAKKSGSFDSAISLQVCPGGFHRVLSLSRKTLRQFTADSLENTFEIAWPIYMRLLEQVLQNAMRGPDREHLSTSEQEDIRAQVRAAWVRYAQFIIDCIAMLRLRARGGGSLSEQRRLRRGLSRLHGLIPEIDEITGSRRSIPSAFARFAIREIGAGELLRAAKRAISDQILFGAHICSIRLMNCRWDLDRYETQGDYGAALRLLQAYVQSQNRDLLSRMLTDSVDYSVWLSRTSA